MYEVLQLMCQNFKLLFLESKWKHQMQVKPNLVFSFSLDQIWSDILNAFFAKLHKKLQENTYVAF